MKNLILCSFLLLFVGFTYSQKTFKIGLEVMSEDLGEFNWEDAKKACADLGDGWRLPTKEELILLYGKKDEIGNFVPQDYEYIAKTYWSSTDASYEDEYSYQLAYAVDFVSGKVKTPTHPNTLKVRAVRDLN